MVIDTSVIVAILAGEPERGDFVRTINDAAVVRLSAASTVELTIVLSNKREEQALSRLDDFLSAQGVIIEPITLAQARLARSAFRAYGKGRHAARLNFGDCFVYALAKSMDEPLLFKGADFAQTDVRSALAA